MLDRSIGGACVVAVVAGSSYRTASGSSLLFTGNMSEGDTETMLDVRRRENVGTSSRIRSRYEGVSAVDATEDTEVRRLHGRAPTLACEASRETCRSDILRSVDEAPM